jgi:hypothetical protein
LAISSSIVFRLNRPGSADPRQHVPLIEVLARVIRHHSDQRIQPRTHLGRQSGSDPSEQQLLTLVQRRAHDPVDTPRCGRLDAFLATLHEQVGTHLIRPAFSLSHVRDQPIGELVGIGHRALTEPQRFTDLGAVALDAAPRPVVKPQIRRRNPQLLGHELHRRRRQLTASAGEPSMRGEELQQQGRTQLGRRALARHPLQVVADQRPPLDQLVLIQLPRHPRTLPSTQIGPNGGR